MVQTRRRTSTPSWGWAPWPPTRVRQGAAASCVPLCCCYTAACFCNRAAPACPARSVAAGCSPSGFAHLRRGEPCQSCRMRNSLSEPSPCALCNPFCCRAGCAEGGIGAPDPGHAQPPGPLRACGASRWAQLGWAPAASGNSCRLPTSDEQWWPCNPGGTASTRGAPQKALRSLLTLK